MLVSSCTEIGADVVAGATVCGGVVKVSREGRQLAKLRQPAVKAASARSRRHQSVPQAPSGNSLESEIDAARRSSSRPVCEVKSAGGMPARFFGDQAKPKPAIPAARSA